MAVNRKTVANWTHHRQDEADAAHLYRVLESATTDTKARDLYRRLAEVEDRHVGIWGQVLADHGMQAPPLRPSLRARVLASIARRFGPSLLHSLLLREESQEVKGYLTLHRTSSPGPAKDAALTLARESAQHASTLRGEGSEPWHRTESGGFLRNVVYGFNDGLTANFGLVAGVIGADVAPQVVLVTGVAGMIADALSMGSSGYLAAKTEQEVYAHELEMEREEIKLMPETEEEELALIYEAKGIAREDARRMAKEIMRDPNRALDEMAREELKIGEARSTPLQEGWVTGLATAVGALIPVAPFFVLDGLPAIWSSFALAMASHFLVGAARSVFTGRGVLRSGMDMFIVGLGVAAVGYFVGDAVSRLLT